MNRLVYREMYSQRIGAATTLSFRAVRILDGLGLSDKDSVLAWLNRPSTRNTRSLGAKTYYEICAAFGLAVPAKAPRTLGAQLAAAKARIAELEDALKDICENKSIFGADARDIAKEALCSGGNGGKSTYQNGFTGATTSLPPETRITVNGKTFTLGEIDKEMTK